MLKFCGVCFNSMDAAVPIAGESDQRASDEKILIYNDDYSGFAEVTGLQGIEINYLDVKDVDALDALAAGLVNEAFSVRARAIISIKEGGVPKYLVALDDMQNDTWVITDGPGNITTPVAVSTFIAECEDEDSMEELTLLCELGGFE